jgi:hypothetical protein
MSNDKHTPTPWHSSTFEVYDENEQIIADCGYSEDYFTEDGCKANAARIVQCVNEYDGLTETIATLRSEKAELIEAFKAITQIKAARMSIGRALHEAISIAYKTLAKIETK